MNRIQIITLSSVAALVWGSLGVTGGYAWYLRSDAYRLGAAEYLSEYLDLPAEIGRVVPRSMRVQEFRDITVYLPDRRAKAFSCESAVVTSTPSEDDPDAYELQLTGGSCELSDRTWLRGDYRQVLESGLRPSFDQDGPQRVQFSGMDISFVRSRFSLSMENAAGRLVFSSPQHGDASLFCQRFNGYDAGADVHLTAEFSPTETGVQVDSLELTVPRMPLYILKLDDLIGSEIRSGDFAGKLSYAEAGAERRVTAAGACYDIDLSEWTRMLSPAPWRGRCPEIELQECRFNGRTLERLRFRGILQDLKLGDILATFGIDGVGGDLTLNVGQADLSPTGIRRFIASGRCRGVSLAAVTKALGWGEMTGVLNIQIDDLTIEDNHLISMDAIISIDDAVQTPNRIEGRLIHEVVKRALKMSLPPLLPESIEYSRFGLRLEVRDEELFIFGSHGRHEKTILTIRMFDNDFPLINEPENAIDLKPWMDDLRRRMLEAIQQQGGSSQPGG